MNNFKIEIYIKDIIDESISNFINKKRRKKNFNNFDKNKDINIFKTIKFKRKYKNVNI